MFIEEAAICQTLRRIVTRLSADATLHDDLMQECLIRLCRLEAEKPGRTRSWYMQNCRFHLRHWLAAGRSIDSLKRANEDKRIVIDGVNDELPVDGYHTNGELLEIVSARDIVKTLAGHLKPPESDVLRGLADGLVLRDIAVKLGLSYPTVLKYRRKIAALAIRLGISPPSERSRQTRRGRRVAGIGRRRVNRIRGAATGDGLLPVRRRRSRGELRPPVRPLVWIRGLSERSRPEEAVLSFESHP